jgi:hypothetical protein
LVKVITIRKLLTTFGSAMILACIWGCNPDLKEGDAIVISSVIPYGGATIGGTKITVIGSGLGFIEQAILGTDECTDVTIINDNAFTCITPPAGITPTVDLVLIGKANKRATLSNAYIYQASPAITSFTPTSGKTIGGDTLTITGSGFLNGATVLLGNSLCKDVIVLSSSSIQCTTSFHTRGDVTIKVTNSDGQVVESSSSFTFNSPPILNSISPIASPLNTATNVTFTGTGFKNTSKIYFGTTLCTNTFVFVDSTTMTCKSPVSATEKSVDIKIENPDGQLITVASLFRYQLAPTISSISKDSGPLMGGTSILITGDKFLPGAVASVDGVNCQNSGYISSTSFSCITPERLTAGAVAVTLRNPDNQVATASTPFNYRLAPTITSISPEEGRTSGLTVVEINGTGFLSPNDPLKKPNVSFGASSCTVNTTLSTSTKIICTINPVSSGIVYLTVTNYDGQSATKPSAFTFISPPTVLSVSPSSGPTTGSTLVTIAGANFRAGSTVTFDGLQCTGVNVQSASNITCTTPIRATNGLVTVVVTNSAPDSQLGQKTNAFTYKYPANLAWRNSADTGNLPAYFYGTTNVNSSQTFILKNTGDYDTTAPAITLDGGDAGKWAILSDFCTGFILTPAATCTVTAVFLGSVTPAGAYTTNLKATATTGGTNYLVLSATRTP